jgi:hypothetical protein
MNTINKPDAKNSNKHGARFAGRRRWHTVTSISYTVTKKKKKWIVKMDAGKEEDD